MFKMYFGVGIMCVIFAVFSLLMGAAPVTLATIFIGLAGVLLAVAFVTASPGSRW